MVRYADDFVILLKECLEEEMLARLKVWLERAGLQLNLSKTKISNTRAKDKIEFLGFELSERTSPRTGKRYIHCQPSKKSRQKYRNKIRQELNHWTKWRASEEMVKRVNRITIGWGNYFHHGNSTQVFSSSSRWLYQRVRRWLRKKHHGQNSGKSMYVRFPQEMLTTCLGVKALPKQDKWHQNIS